MDGQKKKKIVVIRRSAAPPSDTPELPPINQKVKPKRTVIVAKRVTDDVLDSIGNLPAEPLSLVLKKPKPDTAEAANGWSRLSLARIREDSSHVDRYAEERLGEQDGAKRLFNLMNEAKANGELQRQQLLNNMRVFERHEFLRQDHALELWEKRRELWEKEKQLLANKLGRSVDDLVISRSENYRMEAQMKEILEKAEGVREREKGTHLWHPQLPLGSALSGLYWSKREINTDPVEFVGRPVKSKRKAAALRPGRSWLESTYLAEHLADLSKYVQEVAPHIPDLHGFEIVGRAMPVHTGNSPKEPHHKSKPAEPAGEDDKDRLEVVDVDTEDTSERISGPALFLERTTLYFEAAVNSTCLCKVGGINAGSTALYYRWRRLERPNVLDRPSLHDGMQRFFFADGEGVVLPGEHRDFVFMFKSPNHGIFTESWLLETIPKLTNSHDGPLTVFLKGVAVFADKNKPEREDIICRLTTQTTAEPVPPVPIMIVGEPTAAVSPQAMGTNAIAKEAEQRQIFITQNSQLTLAQAASRYREFFAFAQRAFERMGKPPSRWDGSVMALHAEISAFIDIDFGVCAELLKELHELVDRSTGLMPLTAMVVQTVRRRKAPAVLEFVVMSTMLEDVISKIGSHATSIRKEMKLPEKRFAPPAEEFPAGTVSPARGPGQQVARRRRRRMDGSNSAQASPTTSETATAAAEMWNEERKSKEHGYRKTLEMVVAADLRRCIEQFVEMTSDAKSS